MKIKLNGFFIILFIFFFSLIAASNEAIGNTLELEKTFGRGGGPLPKKFLEGIAKHYISPANPNQLKNAEKEIGHDIVLEEEEKYTLNGDKLMPFVGGNSHPIMSSMVIDEEESQYISNLEIKQCNNPLSLNGAKFTVDQLLIPASPAGEEECISSHWFHEGGLFEHHSYGAEVPGPDGQYCYEEHYVSELGKQLGMKTVGVYTLKIKNRQAVPSQYTQKVCEPLDRKWCRTWKIWSAKIEYYFPVGKITLSKEPLYTRYLNKFQLSGILGMYMSSIKGEMAAPINTGMTLKTLAASSNILSKGGATDGDSSFSSTGYKDIGKLGHKFAELGQINRGYARFLPISTFKGGKIFDLNARVALEALGPEGTPVLPHIPALNPLKIYFGTDFEGIVGEGEAPSFSILPTKKNIAYFVNPGMLYFKSLPLVLKHIQHNKINQWAAANADTIGGGSKLYFTRAKNFVEFLSIPGNKGFSLSGITPPMANDYRENITTYGVGNISNLMSLTPRTNSDYILQTLVRAHNMFLAEMMIVLDEPIGDASMNQNFPGGVIKTHPGNFFSVTEGVPAAGAISARHSFKTKWDFFHCPIAFVSDSGIVIPKSFNDSFNKDVNNVMEQDLKRMGGKKVRAGAILANDVTEGIRCFKYEDMLRNNLDFLLVNTITPENKNMTTVANKGEISFTVYALFTGTIGFPGQGYPFWKTGKGFSPNVGIQGKSTPVDGSLASPTIKPNEFRLF